MSSKKELRLTDTLEPEGGDFVRFLNDIERLQKKDLKGLEVTLPQDNSGLITVSSRKEALATTRANAWGKSAGASQAQSSSGSRQPSSLASLFYYIAPPLFVIGIGSVFLGMSDRTFEFCIPVGMFMAFVGVVGISESKKDAKRRARNNQK